MYSRQYFLIAVLCLVQIVAILEDISLAEVFSPIEVKEYQVTSNPADQYGPAISGERVAYTDNRNGNADIFFANRETGIEIQVTSSANDEILGGFDGTSIVFTTNTIPSGSFVYDIPSAATTPLATTMGSSNQSSPAVGGHIAAWIDDRDGNNELYTKDLLTGSESRRTFTSGIAEGNPSISSQGRVAFESCISGSCDILLLDTVTGSISPIANTISDERAPDIDGNYVVFDSNRDGDSDIYLFNIVSGTETRISLPGIQYHAKVSGDFVSFEDIDSSSGATHIGLYRISTGSTYQVTPNTSNASHTSNQFLNDISTTAVREGRIVYTDGRNGNLDIFVAKFEVPDSGDVCNGIDDNHDGRADEGFPAGNTPCGADVEVVETNPDDITDITAITFPSVDMSGDTMVTTASTGPAVPAGFGLGKRPVYHEITTSVGFSGSAQVCIGYDPTQFTTERSLRLLHWNGSKWDNITTNVNTAADTICGMTTSFSPFVVAQQASTAVTVMNISAHKDGDQVTLNWSTASETDNEGFRIYRAESVQGPFTLITSAIIPAVGGPGMKATYAFADKEIEEGKTYYYRLQDMDSKGVVTAHEVVSVRVDVANQRKGDEGSSQSQVKTGEERAPQGEPAQSDSASKWTSVAVTASAAPGNGPAVRETDTIRLPGENMEPVDRGYDENLFPDASESAQAARFKEQQIREIAEDAWNQAVGKRHESPGSSSFSVSIEDQRGNLIKVSKAEDMAGVANPSGNLEITEESGRNVIAWKGTAHGRGFVLHRSEKGKRDYTPISDLIPYFGQDSKDVFLYRFIDNNVRPGTDYDYHLQTMGTDRMDSPERLSSLRGLSQ